MNKVKVPVYDSINKNRLLGYMHDLPFPGGRIIRFPVMSKASAVNRLYFDHADHVTMHTLDMEVHDRTTNGGWTREMVVVTNASLTDLQNVRQFEIVRPERF